jgi:hypothetical protein
MSRAKNVYLTTDAFSFGLGDDSVVRMSFGPTQINLSVDAAMDLQYRLAAFLAHLELTEYPPASEDEDPGLTASRENLIDLTTLARPRRLMN